MPARKNLLDAGDVEEGLQAAASIGDDTLQRRSRGRVSPESWTHGSSEQRVEWLRRGLTQGTIDACDTFGQAVAAEPRGYQIFTRCSGGRNSLSPGLTSKAA